MERQCDMSRLSPGESARVISLEAQEVMRRRLEDIGLIPGARITCLHRSPLGDPSAYSLCGAVIALRAKDAAGVRVEPIL